MSNHAPVPLMPADAPKAGEVYQHYKGDQYKVVGMALHSDETWQVVYQPVYEGAVANYFTRPVTEWVEVVEWEGKRVLRFEKVR